MSIHMSELYLEEFLAEYGIYELRNIARAFGVRGTGQKNRRELINAMSKIDMAFPSNRLEMILFWHNLITGA